MALGKLFGSSPDQSDVANDLTVRTRVRLPSKSASNGVGVPFEISDMVNLTLESTSEPAINLIRYYGHRYLSILNLASQVKFPSESHYLHPIANQIGWR